jgi:hypothetical protein
MSYDKPPQELTAAACMAVAKLLHHLASPVDDQALAAARALGDVLKANGCDFYDLAHHVCPLTWEDMVNTCAEQPWRYTSEEQRLIQAVMRSRGTPTSRQLDQLTALYRRAR